MVLQALAHSVRDRLIERWHDTHVYFKRKDPKRLYFLSLEFLMGEFCICTISLPRFISNRSYFNSSESSHLLDLIMSTGRSLSNSVVNLGIKDQYTEALMQLGFDFEVLAEQVSFRSFFSHWVSCL